MPILRWAFEKVVPHMISRDIMIPACDARDMAPEFFDCQLESNSNSGFDSDSDSGSTDVIDIADSPENIDDCEHSQPEQDQPECILIDSDSD